MKYHARSLLRLCRARPPLTVFLAMALAGCAGASDYLGKGPALAAAPAPIYDLGDTFVFDNGSTISAGAIWPDGRVTWVTQSGSTRVASLNFISPSLQWSSRTRTGRFETESDLSAIWPLQVGLNTRFEGRAVTRKKSDGTETASFRRYNCTVTGTANITVAAGTFDTFQVRCLRQSKPEGKGVSTRVYRWFYAPSVGQYVLHKIERRGRTLRRIELVSVQRSYEALRSEQRAAIENVRTTALSSRPSGAVERWSDPNSDMSVQVAVLSTFQMDDGSFCRRFMETVFDGGGEIEAPGIACRETNGGWVRL